MRRRLRSRLRLRSGSHGQIQKVAIMTTANHSPVMLKAAMIQRINGNVEFRGLLRLLASSQSHAE